MDSSVQSELDSPLTFFFFTLPPGLVDPLTPLLPFLSRFKKHEGSQSVLKIRFLIKIHFYF